MKFETHVIKLSYITKTMANEQIRVVTQDFVNVCITNSRQTDGCYIERRFQKGITIADLKVRITIQVTVDIFANNTFDVLNN